MTRSSGVRFLLDVNVLVALAFPDHQLSTRVHAWFRRESGREWATCALTQAGFLRVASRLLGGSRVTVRQALAGLERDCQSPQHEFIVKHVAVEDIGRQHIEAAWNQNAPSVRRRRVNAFRWVFAKLQEARNTRGVQNIASRVSFLSQAFVGTAFD
jgi:predicted nucleic acid-binding protein